MITTLFCAICCMRLATVLRYVGCCWLKLENGQIWANNTQHVTTHRNKVAKRTQHVAICCVAHLSCDHGDGGSYNSDWVVCLVKAPSTPRRGKLKTEISLSKLIKCFPFTLPDELKTATITGHFRFVAFSTAEHFSFAHDWRSARGQESEGSGVENGFVFEEESH